MYERAQYFKIIYFIPVQYRLKSQALKIFLIMYRYMYVCMHMYTYIHTSCTCMYVYKRIFLIRPVGSRFSTCTPSLVTYCTVSCRTLFSYTCIFEYSTKYLVPGTKSTTAGKLPGTDTVWWSHECFERGSKIFQVDF